MMMKTNKFFLFLMDCLDKRWTEYYSRDGRYRVCRFTGERQWRRYPLSYDNEKDIVITTPSGPGYWSKFPPEHLTLNGE